jgi:hypothetical protein
MTFGKARANNIMLSICRCAFSQVHSHKCIFNLGITGRHISASFVKVVAAEMTLPVDPHHICTSVCNISDDPTRHAPLRPGSAAEPSFRTATSGVQNRSTREHFDIGDSQAFCELFINSSIPGHLHVVVASLPGSEMLPLKKHTVQWTTHAAVSSQSTPWLDIWSNTIATCRALYSSGSVGNVALDVSSIGGDRGSNLADGTNADSGGVAGRSEANAIEQFGNSTDAPPISMPGVFERSLDFGSKSSSAHIADVGTSKVGQDRGAHAAHAHDDGAHDAAGTADGGPRAKHAGFLGGETLHLKKNAAHGTTQVAVSSQPANPVSTLMPRICVRGPLKNDDGTVDVVHGSVLTQQLASAGNRYGAVGQAEVSRAASPFLPRAKRSAPKQAARPTSETGTPSTGQGPPPTVLNLVALRLHLPRNATAHRNPPAIGLSHLHHNYHRSSIADPR